MTRRFGSSIILRISEDGTKAYHKSLHIFKIAQIPPVKHMSYQRGKDKFYPTNASKQTYMSMKLILNDILFSVISINYTWMELPAELDETLMSIFHNNY